MKKDWYDEEVHRKLSDSTIYIPSCKAQYDMMTTTFSGKIKTMELKLSDSAEFKSLIINDHKAATFYLLPKVHTKFEKFPPGRPISSTCKAINRNISALVDYLLKPAMCTVPTILMDTALFLILLNHFILPKNLF